MNDEKRQCLVWHRADQSGLLRAVAEAAGLEIAVAGTPERGRAVAELWPGDVRGADDLRAAIATGGAGLALLADPAGFGEDPADAAAVEAFVRRGGKVISFEPMPPAMRSLSAGWADSVDGTPLHALVGFAGDARATPAIRGALEALEHFGPVAALAVNCTAGPDAGSLGARLIGAMELIYLIAGEPEFINASLSQPRAVRDERLHELDGTLTANIRFADHRTATVLASAVSRPWHRGITILGAGGRMRIWDEGFAWTGPDGSPVDEHRTEEVAGHPSARHIAAAVSAALSGPATGGAGPGLPPRVHGPAVLAMAETALLSVRTGSAESIEMMRRVAQSP